MKTPGRLWAERRRERAARGPGDPLPARERFPYSNRRLLIPLVAVGLGLACGLLWWWLA